MGWLFYACVSAVAAAATAILAKLGVEQVPASLATAIRTTIVLAVAWSTVLLLHDHRALPTISRRSLVFLMLSGVATAVSWLAYFRALQLGAASRVAPIDKLSLPLTLLLAFMVLGEPLGWRPIVGVVLMTIGALLTIG
jgi:bacterial/archaeal transporter family protein